jgi:hypothetical protein
MDGAAKVSVAHVGSVPDTSYQIIRQK